MKERDLPAAAHLVEECVSCATARYASRPLLLALSGGADSVALLRALLRCGRRVVAAHCNFHLRAEESDRDQRFVEDLCRQWNVPLVVKHFDVAGYRREHGGSMEMACRELRYGWFRTVAGRNSCIRILTAHHRDDNIETMMLHMMRSCGLEAMSGMSVDNGEICRPLLSVGRKEIAEYLATLEQPHITDSSNFTTDPDRNFLRLRVIPLLQERWPHAADALARVQTHLTESAAVYRKQINDWLGTSRPGVLSIELLLSVDAKATLVHEFLSANGLKVSGAVEQEILRACLTDNRYGQTWAVTSDKGQEEWLVREAKCLRVVTAADLTHNIVAEEQPLSHELMKTIRANTNQETAWFPKRLEEYCVRPWRKGDYICPGGMKGRRKVADLLKERGIPSPLRRRYMLLACPEPSSEVLWLPRLRRSRKELVTESDPTCFRLSIG